MYAGHICDINIQRPDAFLSKFCQRFDPELSQVMIRSGLIIPEDSGALFMSL